MAPCACWMRANGREEREADRRSRDLSSLYTQTPYTLTTIYLTYLNATVPHARIPFYCNDSQPRIQVQYVIGQVLYLRYCSSNCAQRTLSTITVCGSFASALVSPNKKWQSQDLVSRPLVACGSGRGRVRGQGKREKTWSSKKKPNCAAPLIQTKKNEEKRGEGA